MNTALPRKGTVRSRMERLTWLADLFLYGSMLAIGIAQVFSPSLVVRVTIMDQPGLVWLLAGFYILGGAWGLVVRAFRLSLFELPAVWLCAGAQVAFGGLAVWSVALGNPSVVSTFYAVAFLSLFARRATEIWSLNRAPRAERPV